MVRKGGPHEGAAEDVAGAVVASLHGGAENVVDLFGGAVVGGCPKPGGVILQPSAGEDDAGLFREGGQPPEKLVEIFPAVGAFLIFLPQQEEGFRDVWLYDVGHPAELQHFRGKGFVEGGVEAAVVPHYGIHQDDGIFVGKIGGHFFHELHLTEGAQVTGVNGVKSHLQGLPVADHGNDVLRQIPDGVAGEASGVGGEDSGGQDGALHGGGGDNGERHRQRAFAHAGNVVNRQGPLLNNRFIVVKHGFHLGKLGKF